MFNLENRTSSGSYFSIYGICFLLFIVLLGILIALDDGTTRNKMNKEVARRYERSLKSPEIEKCHFLKANMNGNIVVRRKRDTIDDPIEANENEEYARTKRRVASAFKEYSKCRKSDDDEESCRKIHEKILKIANEFTEKFSRMKDLMENFNSYLHSVDDDISEVATKVSAKSVCAKLNKKKCRHKFTVRIFVWVYAILWVLNNWRKRTSISS